ncbi:hypothetical protein BHM03_00027555 [Ensete ventricosum]|nr:hypothetical protein BHM03_00027555 [Ensete ventricosum]
MGEWKTEDMPLPALFEEASKIHAMASESSVDRVREALRKGIQTLRRCDEMISKLGLFSSNETKDDVSTAYLKYLLVNIRLVNLCTFYLNGFRIILQVPFYIGELTEKVVEDDRLMVLKLSQDYLKEFIAICEALELIPEEELESSSHRGAKTPANQRAKKIARFKRQRAAEAKLQEINEKKERRRRSLRAAALSSPVEVGEEDILDDDGEEEREAWLTTISLSVCKAFDLLEMLKKEEDMLVAVKERQSKVISCNRHVFL